MKTNSLTLEVLQGKVSAETYEPAGMKSLFVFAHGAGAGMQHPFMTGLSRELAELKIGTLRYNFPYMENKKGRPDVPAVAHATVESAVAQAKKLFPKVKILAGGKSFGGRMTSQWAAKNQPDVQGLIFVGFPLHPAGNPSIERAAHLTEVNVPMLFLQGTRDTLAEWELITGVCKKLKLATLVKFEQADHSFKIPKQNALPQIAVEIDKWISR